MAPSMLSLRAPGPVRLPWLSSPADAASGGIGSGGRYGEPPLLLPVVPGGWIDGGHHGEPHQFVLDHGASAAAFEGTGATRQGAGVHFDSAAAAPPPAFIDFLGVGAT
nr:unnamed protein product [Digitaria exilis]